MPRITVFDPFGMAYRCDTRQAETILRAWFDEILPRTWYAGRPGIDDFDVVWPHVNVFPMFDERNAGADWLTDSRVLGRYEELRAKNGDEGLAELLRIRRALEAELGEYSHRRAP